MSLEQDARDMQAQLQWLAGRRKAGDEFPSWEALDEIVATSTRISVQLAEGQQQAAEGEIRAMQQLNSTLKRELEFHAELAAARQADEVFWARLEGAFSTLSAAVGGRYGTLTASAELARPPDADGFAVIGENGETLLLRQPPDGESDSNGGSAS